VNDRNLRGPQPIRPDELGDGDDRELRDALATGRALDASIDDVPMRVSEDFTRRVMTAVAREPVPGPVGFMTPLRRHGLLAGFGESVRQAWAAIGSAGMPSLARATALAYVLVVVIAGVALTGAATVGVGGALGLFDPTNRTPAPTATPTPSPELALPTPGPQTAPLETAEPGESEEPSDDPEASDDHGGSDEPDDDDGGNSGPGSSGDGDDDASSGDSGSDDGSGSGSDSGTATPRPTETTKPSETPH
jgi:hypothetical protein